MNKKNNYLIRNKRESFWSRNKKRTIAVASVLCLVCVFGMAGIYSMESKKKQHEEPLVNWEDNVTSDLDEKVQIHLGNSETEEPVIEESGIDEESIRAGLPAADEGSAGASLLEANSQETQEENVLPADESTVGQGAVEAQPTQNQPEDDHAQTAANASAIALQFSPQDNLSWPVDGNVILDYSMDATVYFPTLDQYKYNPAILLQSEVGETVCAAASGVVDSIVQSDETGLTVTMDIGGGYQLVYGQLQGVDYSTGAYIEKGATIGQTASPTKYYSVEGCNLYFEMLNQGIPVDPVDYLKEGDAVE